MKNNVAISIGVLALIEKVDCEFRFFARVFGGILGKAKNLVSGVHPLKFSNS